MPQWTENSLIVTSKDWQLSQSFEGDYIRITHEIWNAPDPSEPNWLPFPWYGLIAQAEYNPFTTMGVRRLYPNFNPGGDIFFFPSNMAINDRRIAIRGQRRWKTNIEWVTTVWTPSIPIQATLSLENNPLLEQQGMELAIDAIARRVLEIKELQDNPIPPQLL